MARSTPRVRKGQLKVALSREEFGKRFRENFFDPAFEVAEEHVVPLERIAWRTYREYHKSPVTRPAGAGFANPTYRLPTQWLEARRDIRAAEREQAQRGGPARVLLINGSSRNDQTCPGEMSKTHRLLRLAQEVLENTRGIHTEVLDLSRLTAEYGRVIYPCKACVATAMPLCHWPCSCYPNHALAQVKDWMNEIYPMWVAAHGVMIVTPVHWYQAPSVLKLMIDRLVCADGGNPDPTSTSGKDPAKAKALELAGWHYPRHLAGRVFSLIVHADASGSAHLRRMLHDWLCDMHLVPAGADAELDRYVGYLEPYATSHEELDRDKALQEEVRGVAAAFAKAVRERKKQGPPRDAGASTEPRPK